jgi:hypothetical protein
VVNPGPSAAAPSADELSELSNVFGVLLRTDIEQNAGMRLSLAFAPLSSVLLLALSALACSSSAANDAFFAFGDAAEAPEPIRAAAQAVVRIQTATGVATGVFLSKDGRLLTNNHVLGVSVCPREGCYARFTFGHERGSPWKAPVDVFVTPLHVDVGLDMAVVQAFSVDASGQPGDKLVAPRSLTLKPRDAASLVDTHVHVIGHPHGRLKKWTSGDVVDLDGLWFRATAAALPGNSGSPVLDDDGHIVGLLHRAPVGEELITQNGANLYSVATTAAALEAAFGAELPATVQTISGPSPSVTTADDVASDHVIYLNAHAATAQVEGAEREVLTILGEACDRGLARGDYTSPEDFSDGVSACSAAMRWISCTPSTSTSSWGVCPDEAAKTAWRERYQQLSFRQQELNGKLWLDAVSFAQKGLESTEEQGVSVGREGLSQALDSARPPLDLALARYLAAFEIKTYDGKKTLDFLRAYAEIPHYALSVPDIVFTAIWLNRQKALGGPEIEALLAGLVEDTSIDLGSKLLIEEVQYNSGWIK